MQDRTKHILSVAAAALLATSAAFTDEISYKKMGDDWADTVPGADLCKSGLEQSPINLDLTTIMVSDMMEINGYGYSDFQIESS